MDNDANMTSPTAHMVIPFSKDRDQSVLFAVAPVPGQHQLHIRDILKCGNQAMVSFCNLFETASNFLAKHLSCLFKMAGPAGLCNVFCNIPRSILPVVVLMWFLVYTKTEFATCAFGATTSRMWQVTFLFHFGWKFATL